MRLQLAQESTSDIYNYDKQIEGIYRKIERDLPSSTAKLIRKYDMEMTNSSKAKSTRRKHLATLYSLSKLLGKEWYKITKDDIQTLVSKIMTEFADPNGQESSYSYDHKKVLKIFYRWIKLGSREFKEVGDPVETRRVRLGKIRDKIAREDLLTEEDTKKLLTACSGNLRDRALIDVHSEAGTRPGELLTLQLKHVKFDKHGAIIYVDGKTGPRPIRLIRSTPNLAAWMDVHPFKENPDAPLWINLEKRNYGKQLSSPAAKQILRRVCKKAKLNKRVYLNLFRHSEATNSAKYLTEPQLKKRHGWTAISRMPARYVHMVDSDVDEAILKHHGIIKEEETGKDLPKICHICQRSNPPEAELCNRCGKALDLKKALEQEEDAKQMHFNTNKLLAQVIIQMLMTGQIPQLPKDEINSLIASLRL
jgi:integrase/ribosomal protein L40E